MQLRTVSWPPLRGGCRGFCHDWGSVLPPEVRSWMLRVMAPLCRGSCHGSAVTEGVYATDMLKAIIRYSPAKSDRTPPPAPPVPPPPTRRETAPRRFLRMEFVRARRASPARSEPSLPATQIHITASRRCPGSASAGPHGGGPRRAAGESRKRRNYCPR